MALSGLVAVGWQEGAADGVPGAVPRPLWAAGAAAGCCCHGPGSLAGVDWAGLENMCEAKAHTFPTEVDYWRLLLVSPCSRSSALDLEQRTDLTGLLPVRCCSGVVVFVGDDRCSLPPLLPGFRFRALLVYCVCSGGTAASWI